MPNTLSLGPEAIDAYDAEALGGIAGPAGARYDTQRIINAQAAAYETLRPLLALPRDHDRSEFLDLDEVAEALEIDREKLEGASVKGSGDNLSKKVVSYIVRPGGEHSRSARGVLPYAQLSRSIAAYDEDVATREEAALAARSVGGRSVEFGGDDPRVEVLRKQLIETKRQLQELLEERTAADAEVVEPESDGAEGGGDGGDPDDPSEGSVDNIKVRIAAAPDAEREALKAEIRAAELAKDEPRKGVLDATEPVE